MKLNANGLRLYPSTDSIGAGIKSGEIDVGIMWLARVIMWQNAGIPVKAQFQTEGSVLYVSGMVVPKNAANKSGRLSNTSTPCWSRRRRPASPNAWATCRRWRTARS